MTIKHKALSPSKFSLNTMKPLTSAQVVSMVKKRLSLLNLTPAAKNACISILEQSAKGKQSFSVDFTGLTKQDIGVVITDFGEVTGAIYGLNSNKKYTHVKYPFEENSPLVDYYLIRDGVDEKISAKSGTGSASSVSAVKKSLEGFDTPNRSRKTKTALKILRMITNGTIYDGALDAANYLNLPGYAELCKLLTEKSFHTGYSGTKIPDQATLITAIEAMGSFDSAMRLCKPMFTAADFTLGSADKMKAVFAGTAGSRYKKWGLLHYPITSEVMRWLNDPQNGATEALTMAARALPVNQINLVYTSRRARDGVIHTLTYNTHAFSDANFKFHIPSSTSNPIGNRIGMKMITTPIKK